MRSGARVSLTFLLFFSLFSNFLNVVVAPQDIDLTDIPQAVGESFGIPEPNTAFIGGLFMSCIIFMAFVMPFLLLRNKAPALFMALIVLCFLTAVQFLPLSVMLIMLLIVASLFAGKMKRVFT